VLLRRGWGEAPKSVTPRELSLDRLGGMGTGRPEMEALNDQRNQELGQNRPMLRFADQEFLWTGRVKIYNGLMKTNLHQGY
jgi:hypothetical protein